MESRIWSYAALPLVLAAALASGGCAKTSAAAGGAPAPPEVEVTTVEQRDIPIVREWIGTLDGLVNAAIKAEVTGYLLRQEYAEGSFVRKGQELFEIDPRPLQAAVDQANGQLAQAKAQLAQAQAGLVQAQAGLASAQAQRESAEATQRKTQMDEDRYTPLAQAQAVTQQELDNAKQANQSQKAQVSAANAQVAAANAQVETARAAIKANEAGVEAAAAAVQTAKVNLGFTKLTSPIDGIAGAATTQVGNLVSPQSNAVTTVSTLDPIKANFTVSEQEYLALTRDEASLRKLGLEMVLADGTTYGQKGRFSFADRQVNASTGSIQLTALFPNPGNKLRPGQYARVRATVGVQSAALLVPQRSVTDTQGSYIVHVVDPGNTIRFATVKVGERVGSKWIVTDGLKPGEQVVTDGLFKIAPGAHVTPKEVK